VNQAERKAKEKRHTCIGFRVYGKNKYENARKTMPIEEENWYFPLRTKTKARAKKFLSLLECSLILGKSKNKSEKICYHRVIESRLGSKGSKGTGTKKARSLSARQG